jgi:hypothetical protein
MLVVKLVRCLGLNYADHAVCRVLCRLPSILLIAPFRAGGGKTSQAYVCLHILSEDSLLNHDPSIPVVFYKVYTFPTHHVFAHARHSLPRR